MLAENTHNDRCYVLVDVVLRVVTLIVQMSCCIDSDLALAVAWYVSADVRDWCLYNGQF